MTIPVLLLLNVQKYGGPLAGDTAMDNSVCDCAEVVTLDRTQPYMLIMDDKLIHLFSR